MGRRLTRAKFLGWLHAVGRIDDGASARGSSRATGIAKQKIRDGLYVSICTVI